MIGITFALTSESFDLRGRISNPRYDGSLLFGKIDNHEVAIVHTGVGAKNCNERLELLLHRTRPRLVISSGFAGATDQTLNVGDLILGENFSDSELLAHGARILRNRAPRRVKLFTATSIIDSVAQRNEIARTSAAAAVDMETGAIASVCQTHRTSLISLRIISDTSRQPLPAPATVLFSIERQRTNYARLLAYLLKHPGIIPGLIRFSRQIMRARGILTDAIVELVRSL
jgi:adenosylhomocysteine nucleosidase